MSTLGASPTPTHSTTCGSLCVGFTVGPCPNNWRWVMSRRRSTTKVTSTTQPSETVLRPWLNPCSTLPKSCVPDMVESAGSSPSFSDEYGAVYRLVEPGEFTMGDVSGKGTQTNNRRFWSPSPNLSFLPNVWSLRHNGRMSWEQTRPNFRRGGVLVCGLWNKSAWMMWRPFFIA